MVTSPWKRISCGGKSSADTQRKGGFKKGEQAFDKTQSTQALKEPATPRWDAQCTERRKDRMGRDLSEPEITAQTQQLSLEMLITAGIHSLPAFV